MRAFKMRTLVAVAAATATLSFAMAASASTLLFDRGLPGANWNDPDPFVRSNFSLHPTDFSSQGFPTDLLGDDFLINSSIFPGAHTIGTVVVWGAVPSRVDPSSTTFSLYMGPTNDPLTLQSSVGTYSSVSYPNGGGSFCGTDTNVPCSLIEITFSGLNYQVSENEWTDFAVSAGGVRLHATNAGQAGGTPQEGATGDFLGMVLNGGQAEFANLFATYELDSQGNLEFVPIDINVRVFAAQIPEPSSLALLGIALAGLALSRRSKKT